MAEEQIKVLLVEDDEDDALLVREYLAESYSARFSLTWVQTRSATVQAVRESQYQVILIDYRLGPESGVDLIRTLIAQGCKAPIILLTGVDSHLIDAQAIEAGAIDYLPKAQLTADLLERAILHAMAHKRTQLALEERSRLAAMTAAVSSALVQGDNDQEILQRCAEALVVPLDATLTHIWLLNPATQLLELQASAGKYAQRDGHLSRIPLGQFTIGRIAQERRPYLSSVAMDSLYEVSATAAKSKPFLAFAGFPLVTKDKTLGVLAVFSQRALSPVAVEKMTAVVDTIVLGIERRQAQHSLAEREQNWRTIAESLPQLIWTCDSQGNCDYLNQQWSLYSGVPLNDLLGWNWLNIFHPDDVESVRTRWLASLTSGETFTSEHRIRSHDGQYRWFKARGIPLRDWMLGDIKWFGSCTDIEDQKIREETLRSARDELELRVRERTAELVETNVALRKEIQGRVRAEEALRRSERMATLATAASKLAHEIGNPLNGLSTTVQFMERVLDRQDNTEHAMLCESVQDLKQELSRLQSLLQNWRALSRQTTQELRPLSLASLVSEILRPQLYYYEELGIVLQEHFPPDLPLILADANGIAQVVLNLCKNAVEAMPTGGTLSVHASLGKDGVVLKISDSGQGIPEGIDVFEPFSTTKEHGTGLGLAIVRQIILAHKGTITFASQPGVGTSFVVTLPVASQNDCDQYQYKGQ